MDWSLESIMHFSLPINKVYLKDIPTFGITKSQKKVDDRD